MKLKDTCSLEEKIQQTWTVYLKQRYHFANKGPFGQSYGFFGSHIQMWELDHKKAEGQRIDALELWCWRFLRVLWIARRSNQSILKEINPEYSLEGLMPKLQYFGHLMQRANSLEKTRMLGEIEGKRRRGKQRMRWLDSITDTTNMNLSKLREIWRIGKPGMLQYIGLKKVRHDLLTEQQQQQIIKYITVAGFKITNKMNFFSIC